MELWRAFFHYHFSSSTNGRARFLSLKNGASHSPSLSPFHSWQMSADLRMQCCRSLAFLWNTSSQPHRHCWTSLDQNVILCKTESSSQTFGLDKRRSMHADIECNSNGMSVCVYHPAAQMFYSLIQTGVVFHVIDRDGNSRFFVTHIVWLGSPR